jgi:hypothetical protein
MAEVGTIDLTQGKEVIVDLLAPPQAFEARFEPAAAPHPGNRPDDAERISAWADRMRQKRERDQAEILGRTAPKATSAGYWSSEHVSSGDDPVDEPGVVADPSRRARLLGELGLAGEATSDEVVLAYRRLAKQHHPDRWAEADEATRDRNAEEMLRVNAVYRALRVSGDVGPRDRASTPPGPPAPGPR